MKFVRECVLLLLLALAIGRPGPALATPTCTGRFANPITDICWRCMLPIRFGGLDLLSMGQEDTPNPGGSPLCACPSQLRVGFKVSFWEPVRRVDVVRRPFCLTSLGGLELDPGFDAPRGSRFSQDGTSTSSFYQVHWYVDPVIFWLEAIFDNACLEPGGFDVAYLTELDPMWHDDELTFILNPE
ncbi:MAG: TraU protein, partial [Candidatus Accumulibacter regalis]